MGFIQKKPKILKIRQAGYLCDAFILPEYRRRGIAKRLSKEFFKWLKSKNITYVYLDVYVKNIRGLKAWKKLGFKELTLGMRKRL